MSTKYETCGGLIMHQMLRCDLIMLHVHINSEEVEYLNYYVAC